MREKGGLVSGKNSSSSSNNKPTHQMGISLPILCSPDITHQWELPCFWMLKSQRNPTDVGFERSCCQRDALRNIHTSVYEKRMRERREAGRDLGHPSALWTSYSKCSPSSFHPLRKVLCKVLQAKRDRNSCRNRNIPT